MPDPARQQTVLESARRARPRVANPDGRCYELAWSTLMALPEAAGWLLVHGEANGRDQRTGHAWLEFEGAEVYDPVLDLGGARIGYEALLSAIVHHRYNRLEAALLSRTTKRRYGPWHGLLARR